jgi:hypothetical protein
MKERPILFSGPMVQAILSGTKTQTRRVIKPQPWFMPEAHDHGARWAWAYSEQAWEAENGIVWGAKFPTEQLAQRDYFRDHCPYGAPGDQLWVRETWRVNGNEHDYAMADSDRVFYRADEDWNGGAGWRPSIFMPRWASRITLEVANVRVQRLQDITEEDARYEGVDKNWLGDDCPPEYADEWMNYEDDEEGFPCLSARDSFRTLWDHIDGKREGCAWQANPWVWAVTFRAVKA